MQKVGPRPISRHRTDLVSLLYKKIHKIGDIYKNRCIKHAVSAVAYIPYKHFSIYGKINEIYIERHIQFSINWYFLYDPFQQKIDK